MKNKADYSLYKCPYSHVEKECGHELHGPEGYENTYGVWCACGYRGPVLCLDPIELRLELKNEDHTIVNNTGNSILSIQGRERRIVRWNKITDKLPTIGVKVIVCFNGVVQYETYHLDCGDLPSGGVEYFWDRDGLDNGKVITETDLWMPLPKLSAKKGETMFGSDDEWYEKCEALKQDINKLRSALIGLVGASEEQELQAMEAITRTYMAQGVVPQKDGTGVINAIDAILSTKEHKSDEPRTA